MCTLTAQFTAEFFCLTMNRDESRARAEESPPTLTTPPNSPALLAPRDGGAGGTWIGVNDHGVVAALLNLYHDGVAPKPPSGTRTRGELVEFALRGRNLPEARAAFREACNPKSYSPFRLVLFGPEDGGKSASGVLFTWRGWDSIEEVPLTGDATFLTSSSWNPIEVLPWREAQWEAWRAAGEERIGSLPTFHLSQPAGREIWAPLLAREKTSTRSITQIEIGRGGEVATMRYWSRPTPEAQDPSVERELELENH